tara:strand:+ start:126 stop:569 length:444 start_codon:yes stop_codon:yes gene_type:complete
MKHKEVVLEKVIPSEEQIKNLFKLLSERKHNISNKSLPTYSEHKNFVQNNPYQVWYLIKLEQNYEGSIYINKDNSIGINNCDEFSHTLIKQVLNKIIDNHKPLKSKPSERSGEFFLNVAASNKSLQKKLNLIGLKISQVSFTFNKKN